MGETKAPSTAGAARISTPPPPSERGRLESRHNMEGSSSRPIRQSARLSDAGRGSPFDPDAVDSALLRDYQRPQRDSTPGASPHRKRQRINGDR